jgi:hypothetical protein
MQYQKNSASLLEPYFDLFLEMPHSDQLPPTGDTMEFELLKLLCQALHDKYRDDKSKPGVQIAYLGGEWYAAIHRYGDRYGAERIIHRFTKDLSLVNALRTLAQAEFGTTGATETLQKMLKESVPK